MKVAYRTKNGEKRVREYSYNQVATYPTAEEHQLWKEKANKHQTSLASFIRYAVNAYINDIQPEVTTEQAEEVAQLKEENKQLREENQRLKEKIKSMQSVQEKKSDEFDKICNAIPRDRYKMPEQILEDAGIISPATSSIEVHEKLEEFRYNLEELSVQCREERREFPFEFKEGKGWRRKS